MTEIINFIASAVTRALASGLSPDEARRTAERETRTEFAGERPYVAAWPKQKRAVQLARLELRSTREIATVTGLSIRRVQQLRKRGL